jgi:hypothetical protein
LPVPCARVRFYELVPVVAGVLATPKLGDSYTYAHRNGYSYSHTDCYRDAYSYCVAEVRAHAQAASHTDAKALKTAVAGGVDPGPKGHAISDRF